MSTEPSFAAKRYPLPPSVAPYAGQIADFDAHECVPVSRWVDEFGSEAKEFVDAVCYVPDEGMASRPGLVITPPEDDADINAESVFKLKMEKAPGAFDFDRRLQVLDFAGISRQIMYTGPFGILASAFYDQVDNPKMMPTITRDRKAYAARLIELYNEWAARVQRKYNRLNPAGLLIGETPDEFYANLKKLVDSGVRAFQVVPDLLPGGVSPASPELDKAWELSAAAHTPILVHIGLNENLFKSMAWRDAPAFKGWMAGAEFSLDPWTVSNIHLAAQNYLTTMVLGGVFERHPDLFFGCAEYTGHWVGPFAENMDMWYKNTPFAIEIGARVLKMEPSDYVQRNVRVACFAFEPVGQYIDRFPWVADVLCFASDFPHHEGGKQPFESFAASLAHHSEVTRRKFFVDNAKLVMPS